MIDYIFELYFLRGFSLCYRDVLLILKTADFDTDLIRFSCLIVEASLEVHFASFGINSVVGGLVLEVKGDFAKIARLVQVGGKDLEELGAQGQVLAEGDVDALVGHDGTVVVHVANLDGDCLISTSEDQFDFQKITI